MVNIQNVLDEWFVIREWSANKVDPRVFTDKLKEFGSFTIYENFRDFLNNNEYLFEDSEWTIDSILSGKENFSEFIDQNLNVSAFHEIRYEDAEKPFLYATANEVIEPKDYFVLLENIKDEDDLIVFVNDVLENLGQVTHSQGLKNKYEVVGIDE